MKTPRPSRDELLTEVRQLRSLLAGESALAAAPAEGRAQVRSVWYRHLFEDNPVPLWIHDAVTGQILEVNHAALRLYGYVRGEFLKQNASAVILPQGAPDPGAPVGSLEDQTADGVAQRHRARDGRLLDVVASSRDIRYDDRAAVLLTVHDLTAPLRLHDALQTAEEINRALFEKVRDAILIVNCETGAIAFANSAAAVLFGYEQNRFSGLSIRTVHPEDALQSVREELALVMRGERSSALDMPCRRADGSIFLTDIYAVKTDLAAQPHSVVFLRDASERRRHDSEVRLFRELVDHSSDGIFVIEPETGRFLDVNETTCRRLGYSREELRRKKVYEIEASISGESAWKAHIDEIRRKGDAVLPGAHRRRNGTTFPVEVTLRYVAGGEKDYLVAVARDVTESREAERIVRDSEERFRILVGNIPGAVYRHSPESPWRMRFLSDGIRGLVGYPAADFLSEGARDFESLILPEDRPAVARAVETARQAKSPIEIEYRVRCADGAVRWLLDRGRLVRDAQGRVVALDGVLLDVTEEKHLQRMLVVAKEEWEETFDVINDAITIHDAEFNIVRCNKAARDLLGVRMEEVLSRKCFQLYHGGECPPESCPSCRSLETGEVSVTEVYEPHLGRHIEIKALPRQNRNGEMIGLVHVVRDITERKRAEATEAELQEQLLQSQKMESVGRLAGGVAHDFNNMLSAILGYSELTLLKLPPDSPEREKLEVVKSAAETAASLTRQLLAFSRKQVLEMRRVEPDRIVTGMEKMLARVIGEDIRFTVMPDAEDVRVNADASQIEQVILNLAVNARDAMPLGGELRISTKPSTLPQKFAGTKDADFQRPYVMFEVADTGEGMRPEIIEKIFEPFFTTKELGKGTGLGLATVYGIVKQHHGFIDVTSTPGRGTTFRVHLPAVPAGTPAAPAMAATQLPSGGETILVVEDDDVVRRLVEDILRPLGYRVLSADSGEQALAMSREHGGSVDLLLSDVIMPGMTGKAVIDILRRERPGLRVALMSGYTDELISAQELSESRIPLVRKPIKPRVLAETVRAILDRHDAEAPD